jgi:hypothetical protein
MADAVLRSLEADAPSAAALEVARKFMADNGCTAEALMRWRGGSGIDPGSLPRFSDDDDDEEQQASGSAVDDALNTVPPFAPAD